VRRALGAFFLLVTAAVVVASLTVIFMSMRSVMDIGGSCGTIDNEGVIRSCPSGVAGLLPGGIWAGLIFTGLYVLVCVKFKIPSLVSLLWPALFLSLAYNFFDYGIHGQSGFVICGIVFALMGAVPLVWALPHLWRVYVRGIDDDPKPWHVSTTGAALSSAASAMKLMDRLGRTPSEDMTDNLERLDELHKKGALDDFEYARAKDKIISSQDQS
jgi:hypothetical protein